MDFSVSLVSLFFKNPHLRIWFIDFRERRRERVGGGERDWDIDMREKHQSIASCTHPNWRLSPQPKYVPWPWIAPAAVLVYRMTLQPTEPPGQGSMTFFDDCLLTDLAKMKTLQWAFAGTQPVLWTHSPSTPLRVSDCSRLCWRLPPCWQAA